MLSQFPIHATAAAIDLARARRWFEEKLGLVPEREDPGGVWYRFAGDTWFAVPHDALGDPRAGGVEEVVVLPHEVGVADHEVRSGGREPPRRVAVV